MLRLSEQAIDRIIAWRTYEILAGLLLIFQVFVLPRDWILGVLPGFMIFGLGIYGLAFRKWRTEPGLWMLALFLFIVLGYLYAYFVILWLRSPPAPPAQPPPNGWAQAKLAAEVTIGLALFQYQVRFCLSVLIENWRRTRD